MTTAPPEGRLPAAEEPAAVAGEEHGELTCVYDCGLAAAFAVEILPIAILLGLAIGMAALGALFLRRRVSRRSRRS